MLFFLQRISCGLVAETETTHKETPVGKTHLDSFEPQSKRKDHHARRTSKSTTLPSSSPIVASKIDTMIRTTSDRKYQLSGLDNLSPREMYVAIQTPGVAGEGKQDDNHDVYTCLTPTQEDLQVNCGQEEEMYVSDSNGLRMHAWSSSLSEKDLHDLSAPYFWFACCCPCIAVPQLEVRMGVNTFKRGMLSFSLSLLLLLTAWFLLTVTMWSYVVGKGNSIQWTLALITFFIVQAICIASRIASLRAKVRARFAIPGTTKQDFQLAVFHPAHSILQMGKHLACDRVRPCSAPTVLPAYEV